MPGRSSRSSPRGFTPHLLPKNAGFTLLEILVAMGLFVVLIIVLVNIYLLALKSQRQTAARQETLQSARFVMETISRQVRISEIDYAYAYDGDADLGINGSESELALIDPDGNLIVYKLQNSQLVVDVGGIQYALTSAADLEVINLDFYLEPATNPFQEERCNQALVPIGCLPSVSCNLNDSQTGYSGFGVCSDDSSCASGHCDLQAGVCLPPNAQPRVTMVLDFQAKEGKPEDRKMVFLQTTVSSRVYER